MDTTGVVHYVNPLTLDADFFRRSLDQFMSSKIHLDDTLFHTLECIVESIDKILKNNAANSIVATDKTKLVKSSELETIQRIFHCSKCNIDVGRSVINAAAHLHNQHKSDAKHKKRAKAENRASKLTPLPKKAKALIKGDLQKLYGDNMQIAETLKQIPTYDEIEQQLLELIKPNFPNESIRLYKFGSRISGIGTRNSDLDIFVDIGGTFHDFESRGTEQTLNKLKLVRGALKKDQKNWRQLVSIDSARVPILRVNHFKSSIKCDIGFSNSLGYCNTVLTKYLFEIQPMLRRMCMFLKKWLERSKMHEQLPTYTFILMAIFYLQVHNYLPSIECLQNEMPNQVNVGPWITNFLSKTLIELKIEAIELTAKNNTKFVQDFFRYYAQFDFNTYIVCPYFGKPIKITNVDNEMPQHYKDYVKSNESSKEALEINKPIVVQDPIQLTHNVTKSVSPVIFKHIIHYFRQSDEAFNA